MGSVVRVHTLGSVRDDAAPTAPRRRRRLGLVTALVVALLVAVPSTVALAVAPVGGAIYRGSGVQYFNNHKCLSGPGLNCYGLDRGRQKFSFQVSPNGKVLEQFVGGFNCGCACRENSISINKMVAIKRGSFSATGTMPGGNFTYKVKLTGHFTGRGKRASIKYQVTGMPPPPCGTRVIGTAHTR